MGREEGDEEEVELEENLNAMFRPDELVQSRFQKIAFTPHHPHSCIP
jgi:hypothetical protein